MNWIKTVFHIHSDYSDDSDLSVERIYELAREKNISCVAITDHDTILGAQALQAIAGPDLKVIIGEEISTAQGHLIGLFLKEHIEPGQSARRTAELIRRQGGLVIVPHPFNNFYSCGLQSAVRDLLDLIDAVEICNAQNLLDSINRKAADLAREHNFARIVGSDVHHGTGLDRCHQYIPDFDGPETFKAALRHGGFVMNRHPIGYFIKTAWILFRYKFGLGLPAAIGRNCPVDRSAYPATISGKAIAEKAA